MVKVPAAENKKHDSKELLNTPKNGFVQRKKNQKFKQTPAGKVALINGSKIKKNNNNMKQKQKNSSPQKHVEKNKEKSEQKASKEELNDSKGDESTSDEDINEGIDSREQTFIEETDDSDSEVASEQGEKDETEESEEESEGQSVPNILGASLADDTDEDDEEFQADIEEAEVNKGVKMFKGSRSKRNKDAVKDSDKSGAASSLVEGEEEMDEDEDSSNDDDDNENEEDEEDDDDENEEDDSEDDEVQEEDNSSSDDDEGEESGVGLKALLGNSIAEEDEDDEDFVEPEKDEEDDDISDEDEEEEDEEQKGKNDEEDDDASVNELKADKRTIFVGNLPKEVTKKQIQKLFKKFGEIDAVRIRGVVGKTPNMPKKVAAITKNLHPKLKSVYAYVRFVSEDSIKPALSLNGTVFEGNHLRVDYASSEKKYDPKRSVFLGNLPFKITENAVRKHFENCGEIDSIRIITDNKTGMGKGCGYINFKSEDSVALAFELNGTTLLNRSIIVKPYVTGHKKKPGKRRHSAKGDANSSKKLKHDTGKSVPKDGAKTVEKGQKPGKQGSPQQKGAFQGQKAEKKKKQKENKFEKKKKILAQKLLAKPKKPAN